MGKIANEGQYNIYILFLNIINDMKTNKYTVSVI
jgi:hypothetical protein